MLTDGNPLPDQPLVSVNPKTLQINNLEQLPNDLQRIVNERMVKRFKFTPDQEGIVEVYGKGCPRPPPITDVDEVKELLEEKGWLDVTQPLSQLPNLHPVVRRAFRMMEEDWFKLQHVNSMVNNVNYRKLHPQDWDTFFHYVTDGQRLLKSMLYLLPLGVENGLKTLKLAKTLFDGEDEAIASELVFGREWQETMRKNFPFRQTIAKLERRFRVFMNNIPDQVDYFSPYVIKRYFQPLAARYAVDMQTPEGRKRWEEIAQHDLKKAITGARELKASVNHKKALAAEASALPQPA
jgi:hypothetical protein